MKKALVTGASGFIACHLIAELERCDWQVTGVDSRAAQAADLRPQPATEPHRMTGNPAAGLAIDRAKRGSF